MDLLKGVSLGPQPSKYVPVPFAIHLVHIVMDDAYLLVFMCRISLVSAGFARVVVRALVSGSSMHYLKVCLKTVVSLIIRFEIQPQTDKTKKTH